MNKYEHGGRIYDKEIRLDFSANINPYGMPEGVKKAIRDGVDQYHLYPDDDVLELKRALALSEGIDSEYLIVGNGASDLIYRICQSMKPRKACVLAPTFSEYEKALRSVGSEVEYMELKEENQFCFQSTLLEQLTDDCEVLFLCNPNNPTGNVISPDDIANVLEICMKKQIFLVLDECFLDFIEEHELYSGKQFLKNDKYSQNFFVLKAFTKLYGMAGIRLGYGICKNKDLIQAMKFHGPAWNVSTPAQLAGMAALKELDYVKQTRTTIHIERNYLVNRLETIGFQVVPSQVNYLLFNAPEGLAEHCLQQGILIRSCENYIGLNNQYYRIAIRLHEENKELIRCFLNFQNIHKKN